MILPSFVSYKALTFTAFAFTILIFFHVIGIISTVFLTPVGLILFFLLLDFAVPLGAGALAGFNRQESVIITLAVFLLSIVMFFMFPSTDSTILTLETLASYFIASSIVVRM